MLRRKAGPSRGQHAHGRRRVAFVIAEQEISGKLPAPSSSGRLMRIEELFDLMGVLATLVFVALVLGWLACSVSAVLA